ncbi:DEKNAAC103200 [Brettanomyces naardenensis]|uniref:DEKNAAC103200 n=1 Tax=Brettanomyces naardenensis TaxID=13370 RepID=A0A448YML2_BRENA|nr:DEKNAAC103200 [Brettanomyces naardenensis]
MSDSTKKRTIEVDFSEKEISSEEIPYAPPPGKDLEGSADLILTNTLELSEEKNKSNPFVNPKVAQYYREVYEKTHYECRGRFDAEFTWTPQEQKKLNGKLDFKVAFLACFMFVALQTDRGNLAQAVADNMLKDLGMTTNQYNNGNTIFYLTFLCAELPSQLISKRIGCDRWIPIEMFLWSLVSISQCKMTNVTGFYITRALLGVLEGGFIPDLILWMSYFYTGSELSIRLSFFGLLYL